MAGGVLAASLLRGRCGGEAQPEPGRAEQPHCPVTMQGQSQALGSGRGRPLSFRPQGGKRVMACTIPWDPWLTERLASSGQCQLTLPKPMTPFKSTYISVSSPRPSYFTSRFTDLSCKARPLSQSLLHEKRLRPLTDTVESHVRATRSFKQGPCFCGRHPGGSRQTATKKRVNTRRGRWPGALCRRGAGGGGGERAGSDPHA